MIDADKGWPDGEDTTTGFFAGIDRWRTANPPPGPRVRAAARLQLGNFRRPHQQRWWEALTLTMLLAAAVVAALATAALEDVLMVLLVAIALTLIGVSVYAVYTLQLATRARAYPVTRWRHRCRVMWLTNPASAIGAALTVYVRRGGAVTFHNHFRWPALTPQRPPVARRLRLELLTIAAEAGHVVITFTTDERIATTYNRDGWRPPTHAERHQYTIPETTNRHGELTRWDLLFDPRDEQCAAALTAARAELAT
ncbi:hypothetical protein P3H15_52255 [Rhodococcus sp. T2V]|uniref:hypothetical protein n=1 Tax=Rhodococcus sp. T2V TaxID=3034164 RepID=UPI0023E3132A|nr:hypothetical protein [Rhodococcus sp. T2V]MDF3313475.1 hypothetical protein [Rhodococcus sp. T2V]